MPTLRFFSPLPYFLLAGALAVSWPVAAQQPADASLEESLENLSGDVEMGRQVAELLTGIAEDPLDVNTASAKELAQIPALGPLRARHIVQFRSQRHNFTSLDELLQVVGMTPTALQSARPYLKVTSPAQIISSSKEQKLQFELIQRVDRRLELGRGYHSNRFRGSPARLYTRLRGRYEQHAQLSLTLEKDPGERLAWEPAMHTYGYDHAAGHLALHRVGPINTLVLGDFTASYGQGLALWSRAAFSKGRRPIQSVSRSSAGIRPYSGRSENRFFRGAAATLDLSSGLTASAFASRRLLDATLLEPDSTGAFPQGATSLPESGYHRTLAELAKKDALEEVLIGGAAEIDAGSFSTGLVAYHSRFDAPLIRGKHPYQQPMFQGKRLSMVSLYGAAYLDDLHLFTEIARSPGNALGGLAGLTYQAIRSARIALLLRHYPAHFSSLHGHGFGEQQATRNETGLYAGIDLRPGRHWSVAAYFDQYRFPWLRFGVPRPSTGHDARLVIEHKPRQWLSYYLQARTETREAGAQLATRWGHQFATVRPETRQSLRLHGEYHFSPDLRLQMRLEGVRYHSSLLPAEYGTLLYQDLRWRPAALLRLDFRLLLFDTASYASRLYAYENDLLYAFSVPAFFGRGRRAYLLLTLAPSPRLSLQVKYALLHYEDRATIGTGLNQVEGSRLRELRMQVRWQF